MGWLFAIFFTIYYFVSRSPEAIIAAGCFAIAGEFAFIRVRLEPDENEEERE